MILRGLVNSERVTLGSSVADFLLSVRERFGSRSREEIILGRAFLAIGRLPKGLSGDQVAEILANAFDDIRRAGISAAMASRMVDYLKNLTEIGP